MSVHDWKSVDAGIFHDFHNVWISELRNTLNRGLLPEGYYALSEQHAGRSIADLLTLNAGPVAEPHRTGGLAVAEAPPQVRRKLSLSSTARSRQKTLTIRHVSGHRIIAIVEIVSPANKDRFEHVKEFLDKMESALLQGIHLLIVDLFRPGTHDPHGMAGALWDRLGDQPEPLPAEEPFTLASFVADAEVKAYLEHLAPGGNMVSMPLFLDPDYYVHTPLEATYQTTWEGTPAHWRRVLEASLP